MFNLKIAFQRGEKKFHVKMLQTSWFHSNSLPKGVQFYPNLRKPNETPYWCFVNFLHRTRKACTFCCGVLFLEHGSNFSAAEWNVLIFPLPRNSNIFLITCFSLASLFFFTQFLVDLVKVKILSCYTVQVAPRSTCERKQSRESNVISHVLHGME